MTLRTLLRPSSSYRGLTFPPLLAIALLACRPPAPTDRASPRLPPPLRLTFLSINDFHGQLDPLPLLSEEKPARVFRVGGAEALAATVAELRRGNPGGTVLLDAGDFMQGSLLSNTFEGAPVAELYERLGVDAAVVGNHEFDFGPVGPAVTAGPGQDPVGALKALAARLPFPLLTANVLDAAGRPVSWRNVRPSMLLRRGGVRIGVVGLTTLQTPLTTMPENVRHLRFAPLLARFRAEARKLREAGAEVMVLLAHVEGACGFNGSGACGGELFELIDALGPGELDVAIAGHAHQCIWRRHRGVLVTEACSRSMAVGRIELVVHPGHGVDRAASRVLPPQPVCPEVFADSADCEGFRRRGPPTAPLVRSPLLARHAGPAAAARQIVERFRGKVAGREREVLAQAARPLRHDRAGPSELGLFFADVLRRSVHGAHFGMVNAGGIRVELPAGPITFARLFEVFPFDNRLATAWMTAEELHALYRVNLGRPYAGLIQTAGLKVRLRCGAPSELVSLTDEAGRPLDRGKLYLVALSDFMITGGDGLGAVFDAIPAHRKRIHASRLIRDEIAAYLRRQRGPLNPAHSPLVNAADPPIRVEDGPCSDLGPRARHVCR
ncbi:MAG: bifunctional metallophosphatase/5'-nucleotidase [Deltaproteobacteria bacterium]|nr:bifunctional metallophosphatase/5'-nucleotidase [Deltaproteobacteria bacterium]